MRTCDLRRKLVPGGADNFTRIARERADLRGLLGICRVLRHDVPVILDHDTAPARRDDDRLGTALDVRPPRVDVAANDRARIVVFAQVIRQRAATSAGLDLHRRNADSVENARHRRVDIRRKRRLHTAAHNQHPARMVRRWPFTRRNRRRNSIADFARQQALGEPPNGKCSTED